MIQVVFISQVNCSIVQIKHFSHLIRLNFCCFRSGLPQYAYNMTLPLPYIILGMVFSGFKLSPFSSKCNDGLYGKTPSESKTEFLSPFANCNLEYWLLPL
ncbi:hypothetical protein CHARACLAT_029297 [Characodon lateralis]|uniref:Uncharacterized protein n=1 Tax=Characodon lateralis TaxID=208331 RepID=A0ABU7E580_9TELE|nr:hypothetical protein [Characodon lateralis]